MEPGPVDYRAAARFRVPFIREVAFGDRVPRVIHQTYPTLDLPEDLAANVAQMQALNPGWQHELYDDAAIHRFIAAEYGEAVLATYDRLDPVYGAARADLFRYLLLYRHGGVYLDIKSAALEPLDRVLRDDDRYILSQWQQKGERAAWGDHAELAGVPGGEYQQWHIIAAPGHPFLRAVIQAVLANIEAYRPWRDGVAQGAVLRVTGPIAYTRAIYPIREAWPHRLVQGEASLGLRYSFVADYAHHRLFRKHYTQVETPLVRRAGLARRLDHGWALLRRSRVQLGWQLGRARRLIRRWRGQDTAADAGA